MLHFYLKPRVSAATGFFIEVINLLMKGSHYDHS
jgi:hypothetical protein